LGKSISERELEFLELLTAGVSNRAIAEELVIARDHQNQHPPHDGET
jgi:ATP/maltotriose-dependent transcriptional regulator MalT